MREAEIEYKSKRLAEQRGWWVRKFKSPGYKSVPDRVFGKNGSVFFVEFKAPGKEPTALQIDEHEEMRDHGLVVYTCNSYEHFQKILVREETRAFEK